MKDIYTKNFPTLFKLSSTGAVQEWLIHVEGNVIVTLWGQTGGIFQEAREVISVGKNIGKKNATTPAQQADLEAASQHEKKLKKGYVTSREAAEKGEVDVVITGGISPMLAQRFDEQGHKIKYPCYEQPKLDGHRCIAVVDADGKCTLWSRTRKPITSMVHIVGAIHRLGVSNVVFDGELYNHQYRNKFEHLTSFIRDTKVKLGAEVVQYHIYDMPSFPGTFEDRNRYLVNFFDMTCEDSLVKVSTLTVGDEQELMTAFEHRLSQGYEGLMARNASGMYVNKRSYDLQKVKEFKDSDYLVTGVEEGRGKLAGHAIFVCKTEAGVEFRAKLVGDQEALKTYFENPETVIGRMLTVKYQGITQKSGVPRFPVALRFVETV